MLLCPAHHRSCGFSLPWQTSLRAPPTAHPSSYHRCHAPFPPPLPPAVYLHRLPLLLDPAAADWLAGNPAAYCGVAALVLAAPGALLWSAHSLVDLPAASGRGTAALATAMFASLRSGSHDEAGGQAVAAPAREDAFLGLTYAYVR